MGMESRCPHERSILAALLHVKAPQAAAAQAALMLGDGSILVALAPPSFN